MSSCDIIIPVWNRMELTRDCIESIVKNTHYPYRIIVVDDGSGSPTKEYLERLKEDKRFNYLLIRNDKNVGNTKAGNQGMLAATADFLCILDNDTLVSKGWLEEMVSVAESDPAIGIVNPASKRPKDSSLAGVLKEGKIREKFRGEYIEIATAVGFCFFLKRDVIKKVGVWDEDFSPGYFEDTEYSLRARKAGYKCVMAKGAYIYHKEHSSFKDRGFEKLFKKNQQMFYKKCGKPERILYILSIENRKLFSWLKEESYVVANKFNWIKVVAKSTICAPDLYRHGNIQLIKISPFLFRLRCVFKILLKKKKYHKIFLDDKILLNILSLLNRFHKAQVEQLKG